MNCPSHSSSSELIMPRNCAAIAMRCGRIARALLRIYHCNETMIQEKQDLGEFGNAGDPRSCTSVDCTRLVYAAD